MKLRPIHLTTVNRIEQINRQYGTSIPGEWLGQVLFEIRSLTFDEIDWLQNKFILNKRNLVARDIQKGMLLFRPELSQWVSEKPASLQNGLTQMETFFKGLDLPVWRWANHRILDFNRAPFIMGILNVTPDSFSDGGKFYDTGQAVQHALQMVDEGADMIDIGGESTRPGAEPVSVEEEMARVIPVIEAVRQQSNVLISVDTYKSTIAQKALEAGADMINDISGAQFDSRMLNVVKEADCPLIIMHIKGTPRDMQKNPYYDDVIGEIYAYFEDRLGALSDAGIDKVAIDPGIGFGKRIGDNLQLLRDLKDFTFLNKPILIGTSRKSFIGAVLQKETDQRLFGSLATQVLAVQNGAHIVRVHDVAATKDVLKMQQAIIRGSIPEEN